MSRMTPPKPKATPEGSLLDVLVGMTALMPPTPLWPKDLRDGFNVLYRRLAAMDEDRQARR